MSPVMLLLSGALKEAPQETHFWNNQKLRLEELAWLDRGQLAVCEGIPGAVPAWQYGLPMMHLPAFGGWRDYVVLEVTKDVVWYLGWRTARVCGVSLIPIVGNRVRALLGGDETEFFAVSREGVQLSLRTVWVDVLGSGGPFCRLPLR
jgi:hypothetical protein